MTRLFENWPNFLHELAGKLGQHLATLVATQHSLLSGLPGGRGHIQFSENRPYKKYFRREKLLAVKVVVSGHEVP